MKPSGTTLSRTILAVLLAVPLALALAVANLGVVPGTAAAADPETLVLVNQELAVTPGGNLTLTFHPSSPLPEGSRINVRAYQPITLREQLKRAIAHQLSGFITDAAVAPDAIVTDAAGNVMITVPTSATDASGGQLRLPGAGLYPLLVVVTGATGEALGDLVTFAYRVPDPPTVLGQLSIAVLASITAPPSIHGDATALPTALPPDVTAQLAELDAYKGVKVSLQISPDILSRLDDAGLTALGTAMTDGFVMSQPLVPLDPSSAAASGLADQFGNLFTKGDAVIGQSVVARHNSTVWFAPDSLTDAGGLLLQDRAHTQLLVIPGSTYLAADGSLGDITDYSQLFRTALSDTDPNSDADQTCESSSMQCVTTAVVDPLLASRFTDSSLSDEQAALYTAADVVAYREQFADSLSPSLRHALILGLDGEGVASAARMNRAVAMLGATGAANFITLDDFQNSSGALINDGQQVELRLPKPKTTVDLTDRKKNLDDVTLAATTVASMLVDNTERGNAWLSTIGNLYSTAITDDQADAAIDEVNHQLQQIRSCIVPPDPYQFTLAGQSTTLFLRLRNDCLEPLHVLIRLAADAKKMEFPDGDIERNLDPGVTNLPVRVVARTNGTFTVTLDILTKAGELPIVPTVNLRARVNTLTGLPQLITGVGLLLLLTWWVRNLRRSRRVRRTVSGRTEHPATKSVSDLPDQPEGPVDGPPDGLPDGPAPGPDTTG
ncbi:MAG: hypothetical protein JWL72_2289 [Ilumatobacteraceae bacterium]|nr:hypothetical protein [Ilumatobacteraceae bacterium]